MRDRGHIDVTLQTCLAVAVFVALAGSEALADGASVDPANMPRIGTVDERFQSYNIEMVEVTGGRFWKPYGELPAAGGDLYAARPPIDLNNVKLRRLAAALAPAWLRVSGTWANATYFADTEVAPSAPPAGFNGMLTRQQWRDVVDFSQAADAKLVTSFAISPGTRDAAGVWDPDQARRLFGWTHSVGGNIAAAEFMNEPDLISISGAPAGYDAAAYGRDVKLFRAFMKETAPEIMILGPGAAGQGALASDLLAASGSGVDVFSYHHYGTLSERCIGSSAPEAALSEERLSRTDRALAFYRTLRDQFEPGRPIWLTETAEAACGGNRLSATFLDTFRYLDQLGRLAKAGVQVVMHNTLAASDYGLLEETTFDPRPNYWGALLWRKLMGATVLDSGVGVEAGLHVYAHCQRGTPGGVALLVINTDRIASQPLALAKPSERFTLDAASLRAPTVRLNGTTLRLDDKDALPPIAGAPTPAGALSFAPATISFLTIPEAGNSACQ
jgi:Glycosyl hydrolase family 79, N-terminal domain